MLPGNVAVERALSAFAHAPAPGVTAGLPVALVAAGFLLRGTFAGAVLFVSGMGLAVLALVYATRSLGLERRRPWILVTAGAVVLALVIAPRGYAGFSADAAAGNPLTAIATVLLVAGTLLLVRPESPDRDPTIFLDAALLASAAGILCWYLLAQPWFSSGEGDPSVWLDAALSTIYPTLDLALLCVVAYTVWNQRGMTPAQWLLTAGLVANTATDLGVFFGYTAIGHRPGQITDLGMALIVPLAAAAALHPSASRPIGLHRRKGDERVLSFRLVAVAVAMAMGPLLLLAFGIRHELGADVSTPPGMPGVEVQIAIMTLCVVGLGTLRLFLTVARLERVHRTRDGLETELKRQALVDGLTSLPNRRSFTARLAVAIAQANGTATAVLFCDLDDFKTVNDTLGHQAGDALLAAVAARLSGPIRPTDSAARLGGDEFAILLHGVTMADAEAVAARILASFAEPFTIDGTIVPVRMSIGIALADDGQTAEELMRDADIAMYLAKGGGKGRSERFDPAMRTRVAERMTLQRDLAMALERDELVLVYQPISSLRSETLIGAEALLRWHHPKRGVVSPCDFIPIAEQSGLIRPIGRWVLETACRQMRAWLDAGASPDAHVSVNVSPVQLLTAGFADEVIRIVADARLSASNVMLEITESALVEAEAAGIVLAQLKRAGFRIAIDDFGTGYSAMSYLASFPIDVLKIDRAFVTRMMADDQGSALVKTILGLARNLDLEAIAEGIEERDQLRELARMGCRFGQGFLLGRPLEPGALSAAMTASGGGSRQRGLIAAATPAR